MTSMSLGSAPPASSPAERAAQTFAQTVEGPSYRPITRILAVVTVLVVLLWGGPVFWQAGDRSAAALATAAVIAIALIWPLIGMLRSRTILDAQGIRQTATGLGRREVSWAQVERIRFVRLALAPRLVISTGFGRFRLFYSGSRALDRAFEQAVAVLTGEARGPL